MASIGMYILKDDLEFLNDWLNQEEEIAFLVSNGFKKWIAVKELNLWDDLQKNEIKYGEQTFPIPTLYQQYLLWHVKGGALPLLKTPDGGVKLLHNIPANTIDNPWLGWKELRTGANPFHPYFGAGFPAIINLELNLNSEVQIPISQFGWIGNHYKIIGNAAEKTTEIFWKRLRKIISKISTKIPPENNKNYKPEIYALPNAFKAIQNGQPCSLM